MDRTPQMGGKEAGTSRIVGVRAHGVSDRVEMCACRLPGVNDGSEVADRPPGPSVGEGAQEAGGSGCGIKESTEVAYELEAGVGAHSCVGPAGRDSWPGLAGEEVVEGELTGGRVPLHTRGELSQHPRTVGELWR